VRNTSPRRGTQACAHHLRNSYLKSSILQKTIRTDQPGELPQRAGGGHESVGFPRPAHEMRGGGWAREPTAHPAAQSIESYLCRELSVNCSAFQGDVARKVCHFYDLGTIPLPRKWIILSHNNHACFTCFACPGGKPFLAKRSTFGGKERFLARGYLLMFLLRGLARGCRPTCSR
jgi:hypothetical protein